MKITQSAVSIVIAAGVLLGGYHVVKENTVKAAPKPVVVHKAAPAPVVAPKVVTPAPAPAAKPVTPVPAPVTTRTVK